MNKRNLELLKYFIPCRKYTPSSSELMDDVNILKEALLDIEMDIAFVCKGVEIKRADLEGRLQEVWKELEGVEASFGYGRRIGQGDLSLKYQRGSISGSGKKCWRLSGKERKAISDRMGVLEFRTGELKMDIWRKPP